MGRRNFVLGPIEKQELERACACTTDAMVLLRIRIVRDRAAGVKIEEIQQQLGVSRPTIRKWVDRYSARGLRALLVGDSTRRSTPTGDFGTLSRHLPVATWFTTATASNGDIR